MPNFNGAGPQGQGSMTGKGLGKCNHRNHQQNSNESAEQSTFRKGAGNGSGRRVRMRQGQGNRHGNW